MAEQWQNPTISARGTNARLLPSRGGCALPLKIAAAQRNSSSEKLEELKRSGASGNTLFLTSSNLLLKNCLQGATLTKHAAAYAQWQDKDLNFN